MAYTSVHETLNREDGGLIRHDVEVVLAIYIYIFDFGVPAI